MSELVSRLRAGLERLPQGLREHVLRVEQEALRLAQVHRLDAERLRVAALGHDLARAEPPSELQRLAAEYGIVADAVQAASPILLHAPVSARLLQREYACDDAEVLAAVAAHTTARPGMGRLEKALFLADKIEHDKVRRKPALAEVRALAESDLDAALLRFLDLHLLEAVERRWQLHPDSVAARNELLAKAR